MCNESSLLLGHEHGEAKLLPNWPSPAVLNCNTSVSVYILHHVLSLFSCFEFFVVFFFDKVVAGLVYLVMFVDKMVQLGLHRGTYSSDQ